jgi:peroxiredoxin
MAALTSGVTAPDISLPTLQGGKFNLAAALEKGPVVLAFFKVSCPVCQMAFPFFERLHQAFRGKNVQVVGVSQDSAQDTAAYAKQFGITFPLALDDAKKYPASSAYQLTNVPSLFLVNPGGEIEVSSVGWSRDDLQSISDKLADTLAATKVTLVRAEDNVPAFKPG